MIKEIETDRLVLRKLTLEDNQDLYEYTSDYEVSKYVSWEKQESLDDAINYIKSVIKQYAEAENPYVWAIELKENHKMIGTIELSSLSKKHKRCELESDINRDYWRKGYNTEALKAVINFCFTTLDLNKIQTRCYAKNIGSYKVMEKVGMSHEGVQRQHLFMEGEFHDLFRYSILKDDFISRLETKKN